MTVLAINCNKTFIVDSNKAEAFKNKRLDMEILQKIEMAKDRCKNIKTCI